MVLDYYVEQVSAEVAWEGFVMSANRVARSGHRRASDFAVMRWLSVGAAGVGIGVAAWSGSGVASADSGSSAPDTGRASHSSAATKPSAESGRLAPRRQVVVGSASSAGSVRSGLGVRNSGVQKTNAASSPDAVDSVDLVSPSAVLPSSPLAESNSTARSDSAQHASAHGVEKNRVASAAEAVRAVGAQSPPAARAASAVQAVSETVDEAPSDRGWVSVQKPSVKELFDEAVYGLLDGVSNLLSKFPSNPITDFLQGAWLTLRRTFFNQAPTLDPSQTTGQESGAITGTLGAVDPESDPMMYAVLQNPVQGTVTMNPDGTYTYTPGSDFDGRDVFIVAARSTTAPAMNVLDLFGNGITEALVVVEQGSDPRVDYAFTYKQTTYLLPLHIQRWTDEAEIGLEWAAYNLADSVIPLEDVTLTITATAQKLQTRTLASASSPLTARTAGFFPTVVQSRIQTGSPSVTKDGQPVPDGNVYVNFNNNWGYEGVVGAGQFDYESVMMHELMHAYGFLSDVREAGGNGGANQPWSMFDKFLTNSSGTPAIDPTTYQWNTAFDPNLTGGNGGLYFYGTNEALAFNGQPVPLYTPAEFDESSSISHLNDTYFNNNTDPSNPRYIQLMNAKDEPGIKAPNYLSSIEIGILKDIGYTTA